MIRARRPLSALLLTIALALGAIGCVNTDKLEQHIAEQDARIARVESAATKLVKAVAAALVEVEAAQRELRRATDAARAGDNR